MGSHDAEDMYGLQGGLGIGGVALDNTQALRYQLARTVLEVPIPGEIREVGAKPTRSRHCDGGACRDDATAGVSRREGR